MEPISFATGTVSIALKAAASAAVKKFSVGCLDRWARYRAERFFDSFVEELRDKGESVSVDTLHDYLGAILEDDVRSEVLYDAYKKFCFSTSKELGPRIIGLLTGTLVAEGRMATPAEQMVFAAAESFSDGDFLEFFKTYREWSIQADGNTTTVRRSKEDGSLTYSDYSEGHFYSGGIEGGPLNMHDAWGVWAGKLRNQGMMHESVLLGLQNYSGGPDQPNLTVETRITMYKPCGLLFDLISRYYGGLQTGVMASSQSGPKADQA